MTHMTEIPRRALDAVRPRDVLSIGAARRVTANLRCAACGGRLIIDHDPDPHGCGRIVCLACGHELSRVEAV